MPDNFTAGETDADMAMPPIAAPESSEMLGARLGVRVAHPGPPSPDPISEPYLMPSVAGRNGSTEKVDPAIVQTPLGGMMPGPNAIAPAVVVGQDYRAPVPDEAHGWGAGIRDGYPEGSPIPHR
jgi:hypothetical protein